MHGDLSVLAAGLITSYSLLVLTCRVQDLLIKDVITMYFSHCWPHMSAHGSTRSLPPVSAGPLS